MPVRGERGTEGSGGCLAAAHTVGTHSPAAGISDHMTKDIKIHEKKKSDQIIFKRLKKGEKIRNV